MSQLNRINDERAYDRLVDGELSAAERRELLASLDSRADGWRRCALAFLEAQAIGSQLKAIVAGSSTVQSQGEQRPDRGLTIAVPPSPRSRPARLAVAAAVAVAFAAGRFSGGALVGSGAVPGNQLADAPAIDRDEPAGGALGPADPPRQPVQADDDALTLLVRGQDGTPHRIQIPLVESGGLDRRLGGGERWSPPAGLVRQLRQSGLEVETRRRYAPVFFERSDGIVPMVVPVDDAYVRPRDRRIY